MDNRSIEIEVLKSKLEIYANKMNKTGGAEIVDIGRVETKMEALCKMNDAIYNMSLHQNCMPIHQIHTRRFGIKGRIERFIKKVIRKTIRWYVINGLQEQEYFNQCSLAAVTHGINAINEIAADVEKMKSDFEKVQNEYERMQEEIRNCGKLYDKQSEELSKQINIQKEKYERFEADIKREIDLAFNSEIGIKDDPNNFWNKRTVSQSGEDSIIAYILMVLGVDYSKGMYLDLGANHARDLSNTYKLYEKGMRGVLVEANKELIPELTTLRSEDIILNKCISEKSDEQITFYVMSGDGLSCTDIDTVNEMIAKNSDLYIKEQVTVDTISVSDIFEKYFEKGPIVLNIDIEGMEYSILKQIDFDKYAPLVIVVECIEYSKSISEGKTGSEIDKLLVEKGYYEYAFTGINSIYLNKKMVEEYKNANCN